MIIDLHTRIWSSLDQLGRGTAERIRTAAAGRWDQLDGSPAAHEQAMGCVDGACVMGYRSQMLGAAVPNEYIAEFVSKDPRRRVGIAGIDPMSPGALDELGSAAELGLVGAAVGPATQGFHPVHSAAMRVYERCEALGFPVFFLTGVPLTSGAMLEFARPSSLDEVARSMPDLKIVVGGLGHPWVEETLVLVGKHANVYAEISGIAGRPWALYNALLTATSLGVMDRLLFGSGFPFATPTSMIESLYSLNAFGHGTQLPSVPRSQLRGIVERDSLACLGIDAEIAARTDGDARARDEMPRPERSASVVAHLIGDDDSGYPTDEQDG